MTADNYPTPHCHICGHDHWPTEVCRTKGVPNNWFEKGSRPREVCSLCGQEHKFEPGDVNPPYCPRCDDYHWHTEVCPQTAKMAAEVTRLAQEAKRNSPVSEFRFEKLEARVRELEEMLERGYARPYPEET